MVWAITGPTVGGQQWLDGHAFSGPLDVALWGPTEENLLAHWEATWGCLHWANGLGLKWANSWGPAMAGGHAFGGPPEVAPWGPITEDLLAS